jgi:sugar lactone lactonase YvrE
MIQKTIICLFTLCCSQAFGDIPNFAIADLVIGKPNFVAEPAPNKSVENNRPQAAASSFTIGAPEDIAIDPVNQKLFISDSVNNRVLRYSNYDSFKIGQSAEAVFGQPNFEFNSPATTELGMKSPRGIFFDQQGRLWVADTGNDRILMFENASGPDANQPDKVFGQPDFITSNLTRDRWGPKDPSSFLAQPQDICMDSSDRLWVADTSNNRVIWFNLVSAKPRVGARADGELGKAVPYDFEDFRAPGQIEDKTQLRFPSSVAVAKNGTLFVADPRYKRILRFENPTTAGGATATGIFGKINFFIPRFNFSNSMIDPPDTTPAEQKLSNPGGLTVTADNNLWVNDNGTLVIQYKNALTVSSPAASIVVGAPDINSSYQVNFYEPFAGKRRFNNQFYNNPSTYVDAAGRLLVTDTNSNRVLRFSEDKVKPRAKKISLKAEIRGKNKFLLTITGEEIDDYGIESILYSIDNKPFKKFTTATLDFSFIVTKTKGLIRFKLVDPNGNKSITYGGKYNLRRG